MTSYPFQSRLDDFNAFLRGQKPGRIPYTFYRWFQEADMDKPQSPIRQLCSKGFLPILHIPPCKKTKKNVQEFIEDYQEEGIPHRRMTMKTAVGDIWATWANGWNKDFWLKTPEDYKVMSYIMENTLMEPDREGIDYYKKVAAETESACVFILDRSPFQQIVVDYAGLENYAFQIGDMTEEFDGLYTAIERLYAQQIEITAAYDDDILYVAGWENYTADQSGPRRYEKYLAPIYEKYFPLLKQAGKVPGTHYDGKTFACRDLIAKSPIALIESLTAPPEGDQPLSTARAIWPDKLFWVNINLENYELTDHDLKEKIYTMINDASVDGRQLAFEISEDWPGNAFEKIPVILEAIEDH